jgi:hypothetical protein
MLLISKNTSLSTLLKLQLIYSLLGIGYNVVSHLVTLYGGQPLSATAPLTGGLFMAFYGLCLITGYKNLQKPYRILMFLFVIIIGYSGFVKHFIIYAQQPEAYASFSAWLFAVGINLLGLILNLTAATGRYEVKNQ